MDVKDLVIVGGSSISDCKFVNSILFAFELTISELAVVIGGGLEQGYFRSTLFPLNKDKKTFLIYKTFLNKRKRKKAIPFQ